MEDTHLAVWEMENADFDREWLAWISKVETLVGHDLDGSYNADGYSLDTTYEMFRAGLTPLQAAARIRISENNSPV